MTFNLPATIFGSPELTVIVLLSFALTLWAVVVAARQGSLAVLERVILIGTAVSAPVIGPTAVLTSTPLLAKHREV